MTNHRESQITTDAVILSSQLITNSIWKPIGLCIFPKQPLFHNLELNHLRESEQIFCCYVDDKILIPISSAVADLRFVLLWKRILLTARNFPRLF